MHSALVLRAQILTLRHNMDEIYSKNKVLKHLKKGDVKGALEEVDNIVEKLAIAYKNDSATLAEKYKELAEFTYFEVGSHRHAIKIYERAIASLEEAGDKLSTGYIYYRIGEIYDIDLDEDMHAVEAFNSALGVYIECGEMGIPTALCMEKVARIYVRLQDREMALKSIKIATNIRMMNAPKTSETALALHNAGKLCFDIRALDETLELFMEAMKIYDELNDEKSASSLKEEIKIVKAYKDSNLE